MRIKVTSFRGHHECDVPVEYGRQIFEKLIGRTKEPLSPELRSEMPENFAELQALWSSGAGGYSAFAVDRDKQLIKVERFDGKLDEVVFIAPIVGG